MAEWWKGAVIYQVYPRSFQDSNQDGIGDLPGIMSRLDHIASLGVDAIWISPFYQSPMHDFGYDVSDFCAIDPIFGDMADFDNLIAAAHKNGLKVILDQVYSHCSIEHDWFQESRQSRQNPKADWFVWADPKADGSPPNNWQSLFTGPAWTWDARRGQYYLHNFLKEQPDLNIHNPEVQNALLEVARFWLDKGVDGFRLDAANFYMHDLKLRDNPPAHIAGSKRTYEFQNHIYNRSQPENMVFIERLRALLDEYDNRCAIAEIGDRHSIDEVVSYCEGNKRLHSAYSFVFIENHNLSPAFVKTAIEDWQENAKDACPAWTFSNHDSIRAPSRWNEKDDARFAKVLNALLLSLNGSVFIYQGEELGLPQAQLDFEDLKDPEAIANWPETLGRDGGRTPMPWHQDAKNGGFSKTTPWLPLDKRHLELSVDTQRADARSTLNLTKKLIGLRQAHEALHIGHLHFIHQDDQCIAFLRQHEDERILCLFNLSDKQAPINIDGFEDAAPLFTIGDSENGNSLAPYGAFIGLID